MNNTLVKIINPNIIKYYYEFKFPIMFGLLNGITSSILISFIPLIHTNIIKILINNNIENNELNKYILSYMLYKIGSFFFAGLRGYTFTIYIHLISINFKKDILKALFNKDLIYYYNTKAPHIVELIMHDSHKLADLYSISSNMGIRNIVHLSIISYILLYKSVKMYILCLILSSIQFLIELFYNKYFYHDSINNKNKIQNTEREMVNDYVNKINTYRSLGLEKLFENKLLKLYIKYNKLKNKEAFYYGLSFIITQSFNSCIMCILIYYGIYLKIPYNIIYEFIIYINEIVGIIKEFTHAKNDFTQNKLSIKKIDDVFDLSSNEKWGSFMYNNINKCVPSIKIKNLNFSYNNNTIFNNFNLELNEFDIIGIKGKSGIGKSTLFKLLLGLYKQDEGQILIDNIEVRNFDKHYYYNNIISYVGQEPDLLDGNINDNILINNENYDIELYDKIKILINDITNKENIHLSGGQKQRVAICRAFMKKPKILLLDEPSSALDIDNEKKVINLIKELHNKYNLTIIIITHSKVTLNICNKIIDFNKLLNIY